MRYEYGTTTTTQGTNTPSIFDALKTFEFPYVVQRGPKRVRQFFFLSSLGLAVILFAPLCTHLQTLCYLHTLFTVTALTNKVDLECCTIVLDYCNNAVHILYVAHQRECKSF